MDQLKDFLRQAIKHRFWIAVGISLILPAIAYVIGAGPIQDAAAKETGVIKSADSDVKKYSADGVPNAQYKPAVDEKREELTKDVGASWKNLHSRQAPLLTWPANVQERFQKWGRKWPENVDPGIVQEAIIEYVNVYDKFTDQVYQTFQPFDPIEGTGIVAAPSKELLLHPAQFKVEAPPELGKVWSAQQRLWIQRTLLQVIADVNKNASGWDSACVKQLNLLEVGSPAAQDQVSMIHNGTLEEVPAITNPNSPPPDTSSSSPSGGPMNPTAMMAMGGSGMPGLVNNTLYHIKTDSQQYEVFPFEMTVLIDQDHIQDFLVALENSPIAIQVNDFEMAKPSQRVNKPKKGESMNFGLMAGMREMGGEANYAMLMQMYQQQRMAGGMNTFGGDVAYAAMVSRYMGGPGGPAADARKGVDKRSQSRTEERKREEEAASKRNVITIHDPYFNIVEVTVYGQARFYNPPPEEPKPEPSRSEAAAPAPAEGTQAPATPAAETPKAEGEATKPAESREETPKA